MGRWRHCSSPKPIPRRRDDGWIQDPLADSVVPDGPHVNQRRHWPCVKLLTGVDPVLSATLNQHNNMRRIKRGRGMTDVVVDEIRMAILTGSLAPGSRIRQEDLAERMHVSRLPVRQAFLILQREGLVMSDATRRTIVAPLDAGFIRDLYGFRGMIEAAVASDLAGRSDFDPAPHERIVAAGRTAAAATDVPSLIELDRAFHAGLYDAANNRVLSDVMQGQWTHVRRVMAAILSISGYPNQVWEEHATILEAIVAHQPERASRLAAAHTSAASDRLIANLSRHLEEALDTTSAVIRQDRRLSRPAPSRLAGTRRPNR